MHAGLISLLPLLSLALASPQPDPWAVPLQPETTAAIARSKRWAVPLQPDLTAEDAAGSKRWAVPIQSEPASADDATPAKREAYAIPLPVDTDSSAAAAAKRGFAVPLRHSDSYVRRARDASLAKREAIAAEAAAALKKRSFFGSGGSSRKRAAQRDAQLDAERRRVLEEAARDVGVGERGEALDPSWLLREAAKVDGRYNAGQGGYRDLLAASQEHQKRAGEVQ